MAWAMVPTTSAKATGLDDLISAGEIPLSTLSLPVSVDFAHDFSMLDFEVPRDEWSADSHSGNRWDGHNDDGWVYADDEKSKARYHWWRDVLRIRLSGNQIVVSANIHYSGEGKAKLPPFGPWVSGSCDNRTVNVTLQSTVGVLPDWRLQSHTVVSQLDAADRCKVTFLDIDVTDKILSKVRGVLEDAAANVDERVARYNLMKQVSSGWAMLQNPLQIVDGIWFKVNPAAVFLGPLSGNGAVLSATVGIMGRPELVFGSAPQSVSSPLPALSAAPVDQGFHVHADSRFPYELASEFVHQQLSKTSFVGPTSDQHLDIQSIRMAAGSGGFLEVIAKVGGSASGELTFIGLPEVSAPAVAGAIHDTVSAPGLMPDSSSQKWLTAQAPWLDQRELVDVFRHAATWQLTDLLALLRNQVTQALNMEVAPGYVITGSVSDLEVVSTEAQPEGWMIRVRADGAAALSIRRRLPE